MGEAWYERAYYYCPHCRHGHFPTDESFHLASHRTAGADEIISLVGLLEPFDEGAHQTLPRLTGLNVSSSTVQRTTEAIGSDVAQRRAAGETFAEDEVRDWHRDASGRKVAYVELDATSVPQQGKDGEKVEGRMPWVGVVFNPPPMDPAHRDRRRQRFVESRCVSGLMSLEEISQQLHRECRCVGLQAADVVVALSDGGSGLENALLNVVSGQVQEVVFVLDFWHAADHLQQFANVWLTDQQARNDQVEAWSHHLKHHGGESLVQQLEQLDISNASAPIRQEYEQLLHYLNSNIHRMNYPLYLSNGWQIGSGKVESSCKSIVGVRLKGPGMRWRPYGTTALCQLRALFRSEPKLWQNYWATLKPA
jgi:hypothetical protein